MNNYLKVAEVSVAKLIKIKKTQQVQLDVLRPDSRYRMVPIATSRQVAIDEYRSPVLDSGNDAKATQC